MVLSFLLPLQLVVLAQRNMLEEPTVWFSNGAVTYTAKKKENEGTKLSITPSQNRKYSLFFTMFGKKAQKTPKPRNTTL